MYINMKVVRKRAFHFVGSEWKSTIWFHHQITCLYLLCQKTRMLPTFWRLRTRTLLACVRKHRLHARRQLVLKAKSLICSIRWKYYFLSKQQQIHFTAISPVQAGWAGIRTITPSGFLCSLQDGLLSLPPHANLVLKATGWRASTNKNSTLKASR